MVRCECVAFALARGARALAHLSLAEGSGWRAGSNGPRLGACRYPLAVSDTLPLDVDRRSVIIIAIVGLLLAPGLMLGAVWILTHGLTPALTSSGEWITVALVVLLALVVVRGTARELGGALRVRFDEQGVRLGGTQLRWDAVSEIDSPEFGYLVLRDANGRTIKITSYLVRDRAALLKYVGDKVGVALRERSVSL